MNLASIDIDKKIADMAQAIKAHLDARQASDPIMIGIYTGGVWVAKHLHQLLGLNEPLGTLDISFYRDDFTRVGVNPQVKPSHLPLNVDDRHIVLVDDVLYTGRTIRAALNEIFDYGRPASIILATLVVRGGRELPIQADVAGIQIDESECSQIKLQGPDKLGLSFIEPSDSEQA